jgi:bisphosphoglycerate-dependent phosphoglycerate mutase
MTRSEHIEMSKKYRAASIDALHEFQRTMNRKFWDDYKENSKLANKHYGISQAMWTKEMKRKYGYTA